MTSHLKRWFYLVHRWLGIALCVVMLAWFISGVVMMYVGYPKLTVAERLEALPALPAEGCCIGLEVARAAVPAPPPAPSARRGAVSTDSWRLTSVAGQPRYIFGEEGRYPAAVDALTGRLIGTVSREAALTSAQHFAGGVVGRWLEQVQEDAWTHSRALDGHRPLHVVEVDDADRRWLYVSSRTGEVVRDATRVERTWGWVGAWLHWLYMFRGGALDPAKAPDPSQLLRTLGAGGTAVREITWHRSAGEHIAQAHGAGESRLFSQHQALPLDSLPQAAWSQAAERLLPGARIVEAVRLDRYDAYYYAREPHTMTGHRERPLPVWRLQFDDLSRTTVVINPRTGLIQHISDSHRRVDRWLFAFLHSFDLPAFLALRPAWDVWMVGFSIAGALLAGTAVVTGTRQLSRRQRRWTGQHSDPGASALAHPPSTGARPIIHHSSRDIP